MQLAEVTEGLRKTTPALKRHVRDCEDCHAYKKMLKKTNTAMAMALPVGPLMVFKKLVAAKLGVAAAGHAGSGAAATGTTVAAGGAAAGAGGSAATVGAGAIVTKAAVGLALTALLAGGAVKAKKTVHKHRHHAAPAANVAPAPAAATTGGVSSAEAKQAQEADDKAKADEDKAATDDSQTTASDGTTTTADGDSASQGSGDSGSGSQGSGDEIVRRRRLFGIGVERRRLERHACARRDPQQRRLFGAQRRQSERRSLSRPRGAVATRSGSF